MSVENRHETSEQPESREQNLEQEHSDNREKRLSDSDLDKVDDNSDKLATDNMSDGHEKDANKDTDKEVSDVTHDEPNPSLEADQQNEKEQIAEEFPEPSNMPEVNTELSNAADASDNRTDVADNERTKHEDICDVNNIDNKVETSSASEGKDGVSDEAKDLEDAQEVDPEISDPDSRKQQAEDEASGDMKDVKEEPETAQESIQNKESSSDSVVENPKDDNSANEIETDKNPDEKESDEKDSSEDPDNSSIKEDKGNEPIEKKNTYPTTYQGYLDSLTKGQKETHAALDKIGEGYFDKQTFPDKGKPQMLESDKEKLSESQYEKLKDTPKEDRDDSRVLSANAISHVNEKGVVVADYSKNPDASLDGAVKGSEHSEIIREGTVLDRFGPSTGTYLSPLKENGEPYTIKERATGDRLIESNIQDNSPYHKYEVNQDLSETNIRAAIESKFQGGEISEFDYEYFKMQLGDPESTDEDGYYKDQLYFNNEQHADNTLNEDMQSGIKAGIAAPMFEQGDNPDGGAVQYIMPLPVMTMEKLGLITEV